MPAPNPPSNTDAITDLLTGQMSPLRAWWTRRKIARDPVLSRELRDAEALFADLRQLREEQPARLAPDWKRDAKEADVPAPPTGWHIGGFTLTRRAVLAATATLSLFAVTGGYAAVRYLYAPDVYMEVGNGLRWRADLQFRGEVRFYDATYKHCGTISSSGDNTQVVVNTSNATVGKPVVTVVQNPITATVTVKGKSYPLSGAGRHLIRLPDGTLIGMAELIPQSEMEREQWSLRHRRENGIEQELTHISYGARDGHGRCYGYFGDGAKAVRWDVWGENVVVKFFDAATGKQVYEAKSFLVDASIRAEQKRNLSREIYAATVAETLPPAPVFTWQVGRKPPQTRTMGQDITFNISNGTVLRAKISPLPNNAH